jgi:hypothetical protein
MRARRLRHEHMALVRRCAESHSCHGPPQDHRVGDDVGSTRAVQRRPSVGDATAPGTRFGRTPRRRSAAPTPYRHDDVLIEVPPQYRSNTARSPDIPPWPVPLLGSPAVRSSCLAPAPVAPQVESRIRRLPAPPPLRPRRPALLCVLTREWDQVGGTLFAPDLVPRPTPPPFLQVGGGAAEALPAQRVPRGAPHPSGTVRGPHRQRSVHRW